jgi:hypothetical protein
MSAGHDHVLHRGHDKRSANRDRGSCVIVEAIDDDSVPEDFTHVVRLRHEGEISTLFCGPKTYKLMQDIALFSSQLSILDGYDSPPHSAEPQPTQEHER